MRALAFVLALFALCGSALAEEPLCTPQDIAGLDRWRLWLADERATIDDSYEDLAAWRGVVDEAGNNLDTAKTGMLIVELVEMALGVRKLPLIARAMLDLKFIQKLPGLKGVRFDIDETAFRVPGNVGGFFEKVSGLGRDMAGDLMEEVLQGRLDNIVKESVVAVNEIAEMRRRRVDLYLKMRAMYLETKAMCDEDAIASASNPTPAAPKPASSSDVHRELMILAREIAPLVRAPQRPVVPVDLGAIDRAVRGGQAGAATTPERKPAGGGVDLGTLDRMAGTSPAAIAPVQASAAQRTPSQDAYVDACFGKEKSAACRRAHCLHVGAALNDKKWTNECLRGK